MLPSKDDVTAAFEEVEVARSCIKACMEHHLHEHLPDGEYPIETLARSDVKTSLDDHAN